MFAPLVVDELGTLYGRDGGGLVLRGEEGEFRGGEGGEFRGGE